MAEALKTELKASGFELVTPLDAGLSGGVCIVRVARERRLEVFNRLYTEHGIAGAPTGGLRLCPHIYNTLDQVDRAVEAVAELS